ncbi:MAG: CBS domain-containing protein [Actinomycetota bacterium]
MRVADIVKKKGTTVVTLPPTSPIAALVAALVEHGIGAVVVVDGAEIRGVVSERDVVRHLTHSVDLSAPVSEIMSTDVALCTLRDDIRELATVMTEQRTRHVPVVEDGRLLAIVSIGDVVKHRLDELEAERDQLAGYVYG